MTPWSAVRHPAFAFGRLAIYRRHTVHRVCQRLAFPTCRALDLQFVKAVEDVPHDVRSAAHGTWSRGATSGTSSPALRHYSPQHRRIESRLLRLGAPRYGFVLRNVVSACCRGPSRGPSDIIIREQNNTLIPPVMCLWIMCCRWTWRPFSVQLEVQLASFEHDKVPAPVA